MEFDLSDAEIGLLTMREFDALWKVLWDREKRQHWLAGNQMGHLIAMVANCGMRQWNEWRRPEEFIPKSWARSEESEVDFDDQISRTMKFLAAYQDGQVARGL